MIYSLKDYQRSAVDELKMLFEIGFKFNKFKEIVLKSPTGSGKTFMISSLIEELVQENNDENFCVLWACPGNGDLHKQSYYNVKKYLAGNPVCTLLENDFFGTRGFIKKHEIVFVNWEKLTNKDKSTGKWVNNLMKDQEGLNFINVLDNTKVNGTKIILIIDEAHIGANAKTRIQEFIKTIVCPSMVLEMSATPLNDHVDVLVEPQDVIDEGMIKKEVIVNEGITKEDRSLIDKDSELLILEAGYNKRLEIIEEYKKINANVNPLVLIQIPNVDEGEAKKIIIKDFLREKGVTEDNKKLKFWCDDKANFDKHQIKMNDDITEYLVFKTAVATGWDCPRAHILIKFREGKSETFEIQTIGRILRTAEAKTYDNLILDNAYIFTNNKKFETKPETYNPNKIKTEFSYFRKGYDKEKVYNQTLLTSFYRSRQGDYNSADSNFNGYFLESFMEYFDLKEEEKYLMGDANINHFLEKNMNLSINTDDTIMEEKSLDVHKIDIEQNINSEQAVVKMSDTDIQAQYYSLIRENLNGLAYVRSKSPVNTAIVDAFSIFYNVFPRNTKINSVQRLVVSNQEIFSQILSNATLKFREYLQQNAGKTGEVYDFKIEDKKGYSTDTHKTIDAYKSLYQPLYVLKDKDGNINGLEEDFLNELDKKNEVEWYWENGPELMRINFGVPYNNGMNTFQPDFIVKFKDGSVGIFDTKPVEERAEDTKVKEEALYHYLSNLNEDRGEKPKVFGGIIIKVGSQFYFYSGAEYHTFTSSQTGWMNFNSVISNIKNNIDKYNYYKEHNLL